jgi:hypothetical protein
MPHERLLYRAGYKYQTALDYEIDLVYVRPGHEAIGGCWIRLSAEGHLWIRLGYAWDGASGPTVDTDDAIIGSLVHDALYQLIRCCALDPKWRKAADQEFHRILLADGMIPIRAAAWYKAVRIFGESSAEASGEKPLLVAPKTSERFAR